MKLLHLLDSKKKKVIALLIIVLIGFIGFNLFAPKSAAELQIVEVKKQNIRSTISSSGTLTGKNIANLKFRSSGKLAYLNIKQGDSVTKGQIIAGLDTQQLAIDLQQAQNSLRDKQAAVEKALDDVKGHDADESFSFKKERTAAEVARDNAYEGVREAQRGFQDNIIFSPIAGLITQTNFIAGETVSSAETIAQVVDFSSYLFDTDIDEADIGKIALGQKTEVTLDAYPDRVFEGSVAEIVPQTKTTSSGATVVTVRIDLGNPQITPINGLSGEATIVLSGISNVLVIPQEALQEDDSVVVQTSKGTEVRKVTVGLKSDTDVEIIEGLAEGEKVVLNPPSK